MKRWVDHRLNYPSVVFLTFIFLLCAGAALAQTTAQSTEPSRQPMLRIETGMHTAVIRRIGIDRENRYLVTASDDKTARVWELASGKLLRILRPPIGEGNEGKLSAVALSPDGRTVAAGGWTSNKSGNTESIYIFDRESGRMLQRIAGLPNVIRHLTYSPDGSRLAATLGDVGVRVYETGGYSQTFADSDYGADSYGADFDSAGRLVTSCYDGFLRLYARTADNRALRLVTKRKVEGGMQSYSVSFLPDGSKIAVGFADSTKVAVVSGRDLSLLYAPNTAGINRFLSAIAWSNDGQTLYAGGDYAKGQIRQIRYWTNGGRGEGHDVGATSGAIFHILPVGADGIIYCSDEPAIGRIDAQGVRDLFIASVLADYSGVSSHILMSPDGLKVQFDYDRKGEAHGRFAVTERQLQSKISISSTETMALPLTTGIAITDWRDIETPKLNGQALKLQQYEFSRSLAIAPDQSCFLLGTDFSLRLFDRSGKELWQAVIPGVAWSVNISGDGRLAVAAFGDGTIRWYRMTDHQELLAFFPHNDRKRWVVWTPSGYYDCSPGAEDFIGWHVNNGRDAAADFFPVAQFRDRYYRPDVIAQVLQTGDEARALELANQEAGRKQQQADIAKQLPPVVEIISPSDDSEFTATEVTMRYRIRTPSGEPITGVEARVDGRPTDARLLVQESTSNGVRELRVRLPEHDSTVSIIAENRFAPSVPATVHLKWRGRSVRVTDPANPISMFLRPKLYILAVGVSRYSNQKFNLKFADKDARDFVEAMLKQNGLLYRDVVIYHGKALTNDEATKDEILDGLDWIRHETTSNDIAMVFFAGHGVNDLSNYYFFCPYNIVPERLLRTGVAFSDIRNAVSAIAGKAVFFVDSCHSGNAIGLAGERGGLDINKVINELSSAQNGVVVFSASTGSESSYERTEWNNGAFTKAVVEGLNGAADLLKKGYITYAMLNLYVTERVKELTGGNQHPTMISPQTVPDFTIVVKK